MSLDATTLGETTAALMETLDKIDLPDGATIGEVFVIAAVVWPVGDDDEASGSSVHYRCSSSFPWVQTGLLNAAARAIARSLRPYEDED
jgi:hypothetical protein